MTEEINNMINKICDSVEKRIKQYDLEKENAELKEYSQRMENQRENYYKEYLRLEQENEKLKNAYDEISNNSEILHENNCLRISNKKLSEDLDQANISMMAWKEEYIKQRKALEEIREIANDTFKVCDDDCGNARKIKLILNKINGVLGDETM